MEDPNVNPYETPNAVPNGTDGTNAEKPETVRPSEIPDPAQTRTYGAVYTPTGAAGGEYDYRPYTKEPERQVESAERMQQNYAAMGIPYVPADPKKKKKSVVWTIIGITAAVILCIAVLAGAVIGVMYAGKAIYASLPHADTSAATPEQGNSPSDSGLVPFDGYSGTYVQRAASSSGVGSGSLVHDIPRGQKLELEDAVALVKDSVVEIRTESVQRDSFFGGSYVTEGAGSGVIISSNGIIITNHHVVEGAKSITVRLSDGTEFKDVRLIASDEEADIAVLSIDPGDRALCVAVLGKSSTLNVAQSIFVIGNPLGELGGSVSAGIISATKREIAVSDVGTMTLIQTDAAVNPGNSGGGLFNLYGELVGIINSKYSESGIEGLGFAIPMDDAWAVAEDLLYYGAVQGRVIHAIQGVTLTENGGQIIIAEVNQNSDFMVGDVVVGIIYNKKQTAVSSLSEIQRALREIPADSKITVYVMRKVRVFGYYTYSDTYAVEAYVCEASPVETNENSN